MVCRCLALPGRSRLPFDRADAPSFAAPTWRPRNPHGGARDIPIRSLLRLAVLLFRDNLAARRESRVATMGNG